MHRRWLLSISLAVLNACTRSDVDHERTAALFTEVKLATKPGLSGLATDEHGALWTVSERGHEIYRITLSAALVPTIQTFAVIGVPPAYDLEAIAALGGDEFALGTEGKEDGAATILVATRHATSFVVTRSILLPSEQVGVPLVSNHGAEGVCGSGATIIAAIETAGTSPDGTRWAPIVVIQGGAIARVHRLALRSNVGNLSALDCTIAKDGTVTALAIERHFKVTKILRFTLPPVGQGSDDITPVELIDISKALNSRLNLEGIALTPDGRTVAVVDNQWRQITGPSELVVFRTDVLK